MVGQHGDGGQRVAQHGSAGSHRADFAVDLEHHTQRAQVEFVELAHVAADHEAGGGGVVGDHALQVELEVAVAGVDHFNGRNHEVGGSHDRGDVAARALQGGLGDDADFCFDLRVDHLGVLDVTTVRTGHVVGDEAEHGHFDAHLLHLGEGGEATLEAGDLVAAGFLATTDLVLDGVGVIPVHVRVVVGDLGDVVGLELGVFEVLGELEDGGVIEVHELSLSIIR